MKPPPDPTAYWAENDALRREIARLHTAHAQQAEEIAALRKERDRLTQALRVLASQWHDHASLQSERDAQWLDGCADELEAVLAGEKEHP